jgi:hypothetical protein
MKHNNIVTRVAAFVVLFTMMLCLSHLPEDKDWAADRAAILQALGVLDPEGKPTARLEVVKAADVARLAQEDWQKERDKMVKTCNQCHSINFAKAELEKR